MKSNNNRRSQGKAIPREVSATDQPLMLGLLMLATLDPNLDIGAQTWPRNTWFPRTKGRLGMTTTTVGDILCRTLVFLATSNLLSQRSRTKLPDTKSWQKTSQIGWCSTRTPSCLRTPILLKWDTNIPILTTVLKREVLHRCAKSRRENQ